MKKYIVVFALVHTMPLCSMQLLKRLAGYTPEYYHHQMIIGAAGQLNPDPVKNAQALKRILANISNIHAQDSEGYAPLQIAANNNQAEAIKVLVAYPGIDLNIKTHRYYGYEVDRPPLLIAVIRANTEAVKELLQAGARVSGENSLQETVAQYAAEARIAIRNLVVKRIKEIVLKKRNGFVMLIGTTLKKKARLRDPQGLNMPIIPDDVLWIIGWYVAKKDIAQKMGIDHKIYCSMYNDIKLDQ